MRAVIAFLLLPGTIGYLVPLLIASPPVGREPWTAAGLALVVIGSGLLVWCTIDFHRIGRGTLAPWWAPRELVRAGPYRWSRNPMYVAVVAVLIGWALWFASWTLAVYAAAVAIAFHLRVVVNEEPFLSATFGEAWWEYRGRVPRWIGRARS